MPNYVKPDIIQKFSGLKVKLWEYLEEEVGNQEGSFELNQGKLAKKFDVSRTSIIHGLKTFVSANLLEKVSSGQGRGNHSRYRLLWTFREQSSGKCNPFTRDKVNPKSSSLTKAEDTPKIFSKGTKTYRYYAMKFRQAVENSTLADYSQWIVSSIIDYLKGKPVEIAETWLIYLRNWLEEKHKYLGEFFKYFYDTLESLARQELNTAWQQAEIEKEIERRKEIRKEYEENPPPRSRNFTTFAEYQQALVEWES